MNEYGFNIAEEGDRVRYSNGRLIVKGEIEEIDRAKNEVEIVINRDHAHMNKFTLMGTLDEFEKEEYSLECWNGKHD